MPRALASAAVVLGLSLTLEYSPSAQQSPGVDPLVLGAGGSIHPTEATALRAWDSFVTQGARSGALRLRSRTVDPMLPTRTVERFQQFHDDVRIWGAEIVRDSEDGVPVSVFGELSAELRISTEPTLSIGAARAALLQSGGTEVTLLASPILVIARLDNGDHSLAYTAPVASGSHEVFRVFIDAHTGLELLRFSEIQNQQGAVGTGIGVLGDRKKLSVDRTGGFYVALDRLRPPIIETFDLRGNLARMKLLERGLLPYSISDLASDTDNVWTDPSVVDAHVHVSWTYDYLFKRFGRSGLDGRNAPIHIVVNAVSQQGALSLSSADASYAINAEWCGSCGPGGQGRIFFGNGIPPGYHKTDNGRNYTYFSGALDIAAHELTHAVTDATSRLVYRNESGALNEAFSDIMGSAVEFFYQPSGNGLGQADYVIGEDIARAVQPATLNGDRSMANPGLYGDPDHYSRRYIGNSDGGGVHTNSGIANHAFYLAVEGGTNRTSGLTVQGVGPANREQIEKVFYRAFTLLMPSSGTFATARATTIQAARDLYGAGGMVERAVTQAWNAVGVFPATALGISFLPNPAIATTQCQHGTIPCWKFRVTVQEVGGQGFTVDSVTAFDYDDAGRPLHTGWAFSFANYFQECGGGRSRIDAYGQACVNWEWHLNRRGSGHTEFAIAGRSDDGTRRIFRNPLRLAP